MHALHSGPLASYNSLQDEHLAEFYSHPRRLRHLRRMGLITKDGDIVDEATLRLNNALKQQKKSTKDALANSVVNKAVEIERQTRVEIKRKLELLAKYEMAEKVKKHVRHPIGVDDGFTPYPTQELPSTQPTVNTVTQRALRLGIDESLIASYMQTTAQLRKIISMRTPPSPYITKSFSMPIVPHPPLKPKPPSSAPPKLLKKKPKTSSCVEVSGIINRHYPMRSHARVTMCYVGKSVHLEGSIEHDAVDVTILQQHCGGNTVCVFSSKVKPKTCFTFTSRRHKDCPFGISIYLDTMFDCRLSTCCEYKHQPGRMLGSKTSHFGLVKVEGGTPCYKCHGAIDLMSPTSMSKPNSTPVSPKPPAVTTRGIKESDDEINVEDIVKRYKDHSTNGTEPVESDNDSSLHNTEEKNQVTSHHVSKQEASNEREKTPPQDGSKESSVEPSKRRSVIFSPDIKELDNNGSSNHHSLNTSQTINDAKEMLKKADHSFSLALTSESDRSDNDVLSSSGSSSADVDMLESRVSQLESGLINDHLKMESKDNQSASKLSDDQSSSKLSVGTTTTKSSVDSHNSGQGSSSSSGSQSDVDHSSIPSDQRLADDQSTSQKIVNPSDVDHQSTSQLSQANQSSSHSLDKSKPSLDGDQSSTKVDLNDTQHNQLPMQSPKDDQTTSSDQTNNQLDQNTSHSDQDADQASNQQDQNNDPQPEQDTDQQDKQHQSDQTSNQHEEEANPSDQGTDQHNQEKFHQSETTTSDPTEQDHNAS